MMTNEIKITQFNPIRLELPSGVQTFDGDLHLTFPDHRYILGDILKFMPEAGKVSGNMNSGGFKLTFKGELSLGKVIDLIMRIEHDLEKLHNEITNAMQSELDKKPLTFL